MEWIGEYYLHRLIGEGGMGKVYEAEERLTRRRVALKVLRDDLARSEDGRRMFLREMTILSRLDHPNVVRCLACTETGGHLVMVLEHLSGETLRDVLRRRGRLPWAEAIRVAADVCAGLAAAHAHQPPIVHRDLKPENVMILATGQAKVMDFGIAKMLDTVGQQTAFTVGTLQYMSPEQIEGVALDPRADLYCLGLLVYELLTGAPPFNSESPRELLNLHCTQAPPRFSPDLARELPPGLEDLVFGLLAKNRDERPPNADVVMRRIDELRHGSIAAAPSTAQGSAVSHSAVSHSATGSTGTIMLIERAGSAQRRGHVLAIVAAIVGAVVLVAGGITAWLVLADRDVPAAAPATKSEPTVTKTETTTPAKVETKPATPPPPSKAELEAKAEAIRRKAIEDREAAELAARAAALREQANALEAKSSGGDGGGEGGLFSTFGLGGGDKPPEPTAAPVQQQP
jgi:serine/threonine-protein kinase